MYMCRYMYVCIHMYICIYYTSNNNNSNSLITDLSNIVKLHLSNTKCLPVIVKCVTLLV